MRTALFSAGRPRLASLRQLALFVLCVVVPAWLTYRLDTEPTRFLLCKRCGGSARPLVDRAAAVCTRCGAET